MAWRRVYAPQVIYCHRCKNCCVPCPCWVAVAVRGLVVVQDLSVDRQPGQLTETRPEQRGLHESFPGAQGSETKSLRVFFLVLFF